AGTFNGSGPAEPKGSGVAASGASRSSPAIRSTTDVSPIAAASSASVSVGCTLRIETYSQAVQASGSAFAIPASRSTSDMPPQVRGVRRRLGDRLDPDPVAADEVAEQTAALLEAVAELGHVESKRSGAGDEDDRLVRGGPAHDRCGPVDRAAAVALTRSRRPA